MQYGKLKRALDVALASLMLVALSPLALALFLLIRAESPGPALFRQRRVGRNGQHFEMLKYRTMYQSAPANVPTARLSSATAYITRLGKLLRKTSLDEIPQLINVVRGDMSIVGPRPVIPAEVELTERRMLAGALSVRPGITGWAQVNGRDLVGIEDKVLLDSYYTSNLSLRMDALCLIRTVTVVAKRHGVAEGHAPTVRRQEHHHVQNTSGQLAA